jgi:hypothetical protein
MHIIKNIHNLHFNTSRQHTGKHTACIDTKDYISFTLYMYIYIYKTWNLFIHISYPQKTRVIGTLREDQYTFLIIYRSVLLRIRNVSEESCRKKSKHIFYVLIYFSKIVPFMGKCGRITLSRTGHRWQCSACALNARYLRIYRHS